MHLIASHFVTALRIPGLGKAKQALQDTSAHANDDTLVGIEDFDVDINSAVEASPEDAEAILEASITDFTVGDAIGKLMAFINQLRLCGEDVRDYLKHLSVSNEEPAWEIKMWIQMRWGSLSDCFYTVLAMQKVDLHDLQ